jgi:hypothetical protein
MLGDFNVPNYDWINGASLPNSYYYNKIKGNLFHTATCFLGLEQRNDTATHSALLELVFSNISNLSASISSFSVVTPDKYHPPLLLFFKLTLNCHSTSLTLRRSYAQGDYLSLYNVLRHTDWSCVLNEESVDSAVSSLTAIVREAINVAIPYVRSKNSTYPHWFSNSLKYYIKKKNQHFRRFKNKNLTPL